MSTVNLSIIDRAEYEIKALIARAVAGGWSQSKLDNAIDATIEETTKDLPDFLADECRAALKKFAARSMTVLSGIFGVMSTADVAALAAYESISLTADIKKLASKMGAPASAAYNSATAGNTYYKDIYDLMRAQLKRMADDPVKVDDRVSVRSSIEMLIRWARNEEMLDKARKSGNNLSWISTHANCSKRCQPYQGKLYSLDKTSGTIDGIEYRPLEEATDNYVVTSTGKVWKNGCISGFNCRHYLIPYNKGNRPQSIPASTIKKQRALETKQRSMERAIRRLKARSRVLSELPDSQSKAEAKLARAQAKEISDRYEEFCRENGLVMYRQRLTVTDAEIEIMRRSGVRP